MTSPGSTALPRVLHLTSSRFFGGPERQMLGLASAGREQFHTQIASFSESGLCRDFLQRCAAAGIEAFALAHDTPNLLRARGELIGILRNQHIDVLFVHGYKAGLLGWLAARRVGIPVVAVSRGWTHENRKVRLYEWLDRRLLRRMDQVVCVSRSQADKVRHCGVEHDRIVVIPNAVDTSRFVQADSAGRDELLAMFPEPRPEFLVGAAGRLSPEKGFDLLIAAAAEVLLKQPQVGFLLFGDGPLRDQFRQQLAQTQLPDDSPRLSDRFVLAGFRSDLDRFFPQLDLFVQTSHTEGMPNVILEALAAGVRVVATDVGGTREILEATALGQLIEPGSSATIARALAREIDRGSGCRRSGPRASSGLADRFSFQAQSLAYSEIVRLTSAKRKIGKTARDQRVPTPIV